MIYDFVRLCLEYYRPYPYDSNTGGGVGTLKAKGVGSDRSTGGPQYPYTEPPTKIEDSEEDVDIFDEDDERKFWSDTDMYAYMADPSFVRADRGSLGKNVMAMAYESLTLEAMPGQILGISPFPKRSLYKGITGRGTGGAPTNRAFRNMPGRKSGNVHGGHPPKVMFDEDLPAYTLSDIFDTDEDEKAVKKQEIRMKRLMQFIDEVNSI